MIYRKIATGIFVERPNRFVAKVLISGIETTVHVKNTGRCKELLKKGAKVVLEDFIDKINNRKYRYSIIAVWRDNILINMDSSVPNKVCKEALEEKRLLLPGMRELNRIIPEKSFGNSRFDFFMEDERGRKAFLEVKGVTLLDGEILKFPDAPTERGVKHINELVQAKSEGFAAYIIFVIQMSKGKYFTPNYDTHEEFGEALKNAIEKGVIAKAYNSIVSENSIFLNEEVQIIL